MAASKALVVILSARKRAVDRLGRSYAVHKDYIKKKHDHIYVVIACAFYVMCDIKQSVHMKDLQIKFDIFNLL